MRALCLLAALAAVCPASSTILVVEQHDNSAEYQIEDAASKFGPTVGAAGLGGHLLLGQPEDGCEPLAAPSPTSGNKTWMVLLRAGNCSDDRKVLYAQLAGFQAAIVYNVTGDGFSPMRGELLVGIPSFFIGQSNGIMLKVNFLYGSGYTIYIAGFFPYTFLAFLVPAMLLILFCILVLIGIMLCRCIGEYRRTARRLLPKRVLAQIPTHRFVAGGAQPYDTCAICLDDYQERDELRVLPCRHAFHSVCVDPWLLRSRRVCPVCKRRLISATVAALVSDSEEEPLLQVNRPQRLAPTRRTYGATLTARGRPPVPTPVPSPPPPPPTAGRRVNQRSRMARRLRRRLETRSATRSLPTDSSLSTADDARLLDDDLGGDDDVAAAEAPPATDAEVTVAPRGDARPKLRPGRYTRLEEPTDDCEAVGDESSGSPGRSAEMGPETAADPPPDVDRSVNPRVVPGEGPGASPPAADRSVSVRVVSGEGEGPEASPPVSDGSVSVRVVSGEDEGPEASPPASDGSVSVRFVSGEGEESEALPPAADGGDDLV